MQISMGRWMGFGVIAVVISGTGVLEGCAREAPMRRSNGETDLPLSQDIAAVLLSMSSVGVRDGDLVFPRCCPDMDRFRMDLAAAEIAPFDALERRRDFHALRVTAITNVKRGGVSPAVAQMFARHSDSRLTESIYTDPEQLATASAVAAMPRYEVPADLGQRMAEFQRGKWTPELTPQRGGMGRFVSQRVRNGESFDPAQVLVGQAISRDQSRVDASGRGLAKNSPTRTRT